MGERRGSGSRGFRLLTMQAHQGVIEHDFVTARSRFDNNRLRENLNDMVAIKSTAFGNTLWLRRLFGSQQGKTRLAHNNGAVEKRRRSHGLGGHGRFLNNVVPIRLEGVQS